MGLICMSQARTVGMVEWNCIKLDTENGRHNMMIYEGIVCRSHGADSHVTVIPHDMELQQRLTHQHHDSPTLGHLVATCMIGSLSSCYWLDLYADCKDYYKKCLTCQASKVSK